MFSPPPIRVPLPLEPDALDGLLQSLPVTAAILLLDAGEGQRPYLTRTGNLRRRALRLLRAHEGLSRLLNLRGIAREIAYWPVTSTLDGAVILLEQARRHFPDRYRQMLRLRLPTYIRLLRENRFPRCIVSRHAGEPEFTFGPFLYRGHAETFLSNALDLFQIRRCDEDLQPHPGHPGCIYGEMGMCLRPCQAACDDGEYRAETRAFQDFLLSEGESLRAPLEAKRRLASDDLQFEEAARMHKRLQKVDECWKPKDGFPRILSRFFGAAVTAAESPDMVRFWPLFEGHMQPFLELPVKGLGSAAIAAAWTAARRNPVLHGEQTRDELLAALTRWTSASWCDGEWLRFETPQELPGRRLTNAARRVIARKHGAGIASPPRCERAPDETEAGEGNGS